MRWPVFLAMLLLAGCGREAPSPPPTRTPEPTVAPAFPPARKYVGRWTGVEGMFVDIAPTQQPDRYQLTMQYDLDHRQTVLAKVDNGVLVFTRDGHRFSLRPSDGPATGLKYLAGKKDCLTVMPSEGYCRD